MTNNFKGEKQYQAAIQLMQERGLEKLGLASSWAYLDDPKRLTFTFSRYKFVARMLSGCDNVLEVGCGDAFFSRVVRQEVGSLTAVDFDPAFVEDAKTRICDRWPIDVRLHDMLDAPVDGNFDGAYSLDVIEHINRKDEDLFIENLISSIDQHATLIIGAPSLESQDYASELSKQGHVNCKNQRDFRAGLLKYFYNVYPFSMNDEVVHTGYHSMSHYNLMICCGKR